MSDLTIRNARPDEFDAVAELTVAAYKTLERDHLDDGYEEEIRDVAGRAETTDVLVAVDGRGRIVGACTFVSDPLSPWIEWTEGDETQLRLLAVDASARQAGVGQALVEACIDRARAMGRPLLLHTTQFMPAAQRLYERLGFERRPDRDVAGYDPYEFRAYRYEP
jgi:GNAT superfamily N-acetyltransferase